MKSEVSDGVVEPVHAEDVLAFIDNLIHGVMEVVCILGGLNCGRLSFIQLALRAPPCREFLCDARHSNLMRLAQSSLVSIQIAPFEHYLGKAARWVGAILRSALHFDQ